MHEKFKFNQEKYAPRNVYTLRVVQALFDVSALILGFVAAYLLRFDFDLTGFYVEGALLQMAVVVTLQFAALRLSKVHKFIWRYVSLREMNRVLKPGGRCVILEFALPRNGVLNTLYRFYFESLLPKLGRLISRHPSAYTYLPESVAAFPVREQFSELMKQAGFSKVQFKELNFGVVILYTGVK